MKGIKEYIEKAEMCGEYKEKLLGAHSKREMFDIMSDINGLAFLCGMEGGFVLPYELMTEKFGGFLNGRYIAKRDGYTSKVYCCYCGGEPIVADTSLVGILGCGEVTVEVPPNAVCRLYIDRNSSVNVNIGAEAICICNHTGDGLRWQGQGKIIPRRYGE